VLIALPDALDQYVVHHPELFFGGSFEKAVLDPWNPLVAGQHLVCAAAERPIDGAEVGGWGEAGRGIVGGLTRENRLVQDAEGTRWYSFRRRPHGEVSPRAAGRPFTIAERRPAAGGGRERNRVLGTIDGVRVWHECHPGAIYLHGGRSFHVTALDDERRLVLCERTHADHYTVPLGEKETAILEETARRRVGPLAVGLGRLRVTVRIHGYQKRRLFGGEPISSHPLEAPPLVYETRGFWIELPPALPGAVTARGLHFMGGIHAAEHAIIGLFPLLAIADRGDVGGISYTGHPQLGSPAVFVYDGVPGGAGLAEQGFADLEGLAERTLELVAACPCGDGCPGCIQSPRCGNGNRPLDKAAARLVLELLTGRVTLDALAVEPGRERRLGDIAAPAEPAPPAARLARRHGVVRAGNVEPGAMPAGARPAPGDRVVVLDLETQRGAEEVGGWLHTDRMGLAVAVLYDLGRRVFRSYYEADVHRLLLDLVMADRVVGFNIDRFDLPVLSGYTDQDLRRIRTFDLLGDLRGRLGFRMSLGHLVELNLGEAKLADGMQSLRWWREGRRDLVEDYCRKDVDMTRRLYELGRERGYLLYRDHEERAVRVPVSW
jgi:DEAD/DEAH box helicase domain-containing protein